MTNWVLRWCCAATLAGSSAIHAVAAPVHWDEWRWSGAFFALVAIGGAVAAVGVLTRLERPARWLAVAVSVACLSAWIVSRTVGLPVGPGAGVAEPLGVADLLAATLALGTLHAVLPRPTARTAGVGWRLHLGGVAVTALVVAGTAGVAGAALDGHTHGHGPADHAAETSAHSH